MRTSPERRLHTRCLLAAGLVAALGVVLGAGCPTRQSDREPGDAAWTAEIHLRVGESSVVDEGQLTVLLRALEPGNRIASVTIGLQTAAGESVEEKIEAVRNTEYSSAIRVGAYAVRVLGFPGVDSASLLVARE